MNSKYFLNEMWYFVCGKGLENEFYDTLSKSEKKELLDFLEVEE
ncbi:MAG: hypothetical protein ACOC5T_07340 [Elusimicrobiota bacterium]